MTNRIHNAGIIRTGTFFAWFETGLEGLVWALRADSGDSFENLVVIEARDWVEIRSAKGEIMFAGGIEPDFNAGKAQAALLSDRAQPRALGYWIHWTQAGFTPDEWARFFVPGGQYTGFVKKAGGPIPLRDRSRLKRANTQVAPGSHAKRP